MELITISIPVYNVRQYVEKALLSALNQTYENIEYIIADDKGTDDSMTIVRKIIAEHPRGRRVKIVEHERNIGLGAGRNTGIDHATGKYIFFMDSDDEITPDCIEILCGKMRENPVDFIASSIINKDRNGNILGQYLHENKLITGNTTITGDYYSRKIRHVFVWNKLYRLSFLKDNNIRCIPSHLNEDNLFTFQVILNASTCRYISDTTYIYYETPDSIMQATFAGKISEIYARQYVEIIALETSYMRARSKYGDMRMREIIFRYIVFQAEYYARNIRRSNVINHQQKKTYLKQLLKFPTSLKEIMKFKKRIFFLLMYLIFILPFGHIAFEFISNIKQKIFGN